MLGQRLEERGRRRLRQQGRRAPRRVMDHRAILGHHALEQIEQLEPGCQVVQRSPTDRTSLTPAARARSSARTVSSETYPSDAIVPS